MPGLLIEAVNRGKEYQLGMGSASNVNPVLYLPARQQQTDSEIPARPPNQFNNAIFDIANVRKHLL